MYRWIGIVCALLLGLLLVSSRALADETVAAQIRGHAGTHRILVLGEYHGTREIPLVVAQLADDYSRDGTPLVLALEMPRGENASLQAYLDSNGDADARHALRLRAQASGRCAGGNAAAANGLAAH